MKSNVTDIAIVECKLSIHYWISLLQGYAAKDDPGLLTQIKFHLTRYDSSS
jgi:hypothetical protein